MRRIEFTTYGSAHAVGGFAPGMIARIDDETARHLVDEARCARYLDAAPAVTPGPTPEPAKAAPKRRTKA